MVGGLSNYDSSAVKGTMKNNVQKIASSNVGGVSNLISPASKRHIMRAKTNLVTPTMGPKYELAFLGDSTDQY